MGNKVHEGVREILEGNKYGNTRISGGVGNNRKSPSHLHISFPTREIISWNVLEKLPLPKEGDSPFSLSEPSSTSG